MYAKFIYEAIKHLSPKSNEEIDKYFDELAEEAADILIKYYNFIDYTDAYDYVYDHKKKILALINDDLPFNEILHIIIFGSWINEAIKHLSPKSEEEIIDSFKNMEPQEKLKTGILNNFPELVEEAIKDGVDVNQRIITTPESIYNGVIDNTPLGLAMSYALSPIVKILLDAGAKITPDIYDTAKFYAKEIKMFDNNEILRLINDKKYDIQRTIVNESIKHLSPRSEDEISTMLSKMMPREKIDYGLKVDDVNLIINAIDEDESEAGWWLLRVAIAYSDNKLINRILKIKNLWKDDEKFLIAPTLQMVRDMKQVDLMNKLLKRDEVINTLTDSEYEKFENWLHKKRIDKLRGDEILGDRQYENLLLKGEINEAINLEKIKTLVSKISDRNSFLQKVVSKFNITTNPNIKNYLSIILVVLVLSSPFFHKQIIEKEKVTKIASELVKKNKITLVDIKQLTMGTTSLASTIPPTIIKNAINIEIAKISPSSKELIKNHEKLKLNAYAIGDGMITIGYGHAEPAKASVFNVGDHITQAQALKLFEDDIKETENGIKRLFKQWKNEGLQIKITQGMFDSMISMGYNIGIYGLRKTKFIQYLKKSDYINAAKKIKTTNIAAKVKNKQGDTIFVKMPGLIDRRQLEHNLFVKGIYKIK